MTNVHTVPCPVCAEELEEKRTRKDKPYFVCEACGVQVFVRFRRGIELLARAGSRRIGGRIFVLCRKCGVAVEKSKAKTTGGILSEPGIYCPECDGLLLAQDQLEELVRE